MNRSPKVKVIVTLIMHNIRLTFFQSMNLISYSAYMTSMYHAYIAALQLKVILNFIRAVVVRHLPFLSISRQIRRQALPLQRDEGQRRR